MQKCMQLPVHTFLKLSKPHFQTGSDVSSSPARKYRCLLDPCVSNWKHLIFPYRSHTMKCRGQFGWLSWINRMFCLCWWCPGAPALYQPCESIPLPKLALLLFQQVSLFLHLSNHPLHSWSWIPSSKFENSHCRTVQSTLTPAWHSVNSAAQAQKPTQT